MVTPAYMRLMAAYNSEMNRRLYEAASRLTDPARRAERGAFFGSIHATLSHLIWADRQWMSRFDGWDKPVAPIGQSGAMVPSFDEMRRQRTQYDAGIEAWAGQVAPDWLEGDLTWFSGASLREMTRPRAVLVMHLFNHQTHHRGQVHAMLTAAGERTGETDLPWVVAVPEEFCR